jgi:hypothetical protein
LCCFENELEQMRKMHQTLRMNGLCANFRYMLMHGSTQQNQLKAEILDIAFIHKANKR